jgi:hypothetical protein
MPPTPEQIEQLFAIHNGDERKRENLLRAYNFDDTRTWVDDNGYRLSDRIWRARREVRSQIDRVLREAIANGTDALEVAELLEQYLDPSRAPVRNQFGRLIRNQRKSIVTKSPGRGGAGSFFARRISRTEISRAHALATEQAAIRNPFVTGIRWTLSGSHPRSDPCNVNAERDSGLGPGVYDPAQAPVMPQHPHCLCHWQPVVTDDIDAVVADLRTRYGLAE